MAKNDDEKTTTPTAAKPERTLSASSSNDEAAALRARVTELQGQLDERTAQRDEAAARVRVVEAENAALLKRLGEASVNFPDLGDDSFEVAGSATIPGRNGAKLEIRKGDVVTLGAAEKVAAVVKGRVKIYEINDAGLAELKGLGLLR